LPGVTARFSFPLHADSLLPLGIKVPITLTLTQLSINTTYPLYIGSNPLETFEGGVYHTAGWTQGTYPWTTDNTGAYAGSYCLRSTAALTHSQTAEVSISVTLCEPDSISFFYKVSSEASYDKFHFYIDNNDLVTESGEIDWTRAAFLVPAGSHMLKFTYAKDYSVSRNSDCAWIDNVFLPHQSRPVVFRTDDLCAGSQYVVYGDTINTAEAGAGTYIDNSGSSPSDTVRLIDYIIHPTYNTIDSLVACDSLTWHDSTYTASTFNSQLSTLNSYGCDSTVTLHLTIHHSYAAEETFSDCDTLYWRDNTYIATTDTTERLTTADGCDSITSYHLVVNHSVLDIIFDTTTSETYTWNDSVYTTSGIYTQVFSTEQGCDSIVMLMLTIINGGPQGIETPSTIETVKVYPNPTNGWFTVNADGLLKVDVIDNAGRLVETFSGTNKFDLSRLPTGNYLLRIKMQSGFVTCRIVKQ
jgi:hypothetical protein